MKFELQNTTIRFCGQKFDLLSSRDSNQFHQHFTSTFFGTKVFQAAFLYLQLAIVFFWSKNICTKAACKMLMKLITVVYFIIILQAPFLPISFRQKISNKNRELRKASKNAFIRKS